MVCKPINCNASLINIQSDFKEIIILGNIKEVEEIGEYKYFINNTNKLRSRSSSKKGEKGSIVLFPDMKSL